jgi:hypothetical protein
MYEIVLPGIKRLSLSLEQTAESLRAVAATFRQAEEEAGRLFAPVGFLGKPRTGIGQDNGDGKCHQQ